MIDAIMNLNPVFGISVSAVLLVIIGFIPYLVGRLLLAKHVDMKAENVATLLYRSVGILLGLMLSLSFIETRSEYVKIQNSVELEEKEITELGRDLVRLGSNDSKQLLSKLIEYTKTVISEEWSELAAGRQSQKALGLYEEIENGILAIKLDSPFQKDLKNRLLKDIDEISDHRTTRVFAGNVTMG